MSLYALQSACSDVGAGVEGEGAQANKGNSARVHYLCPYCSLIYSRIVVM
jgi:hypothetical protein